MHMSVAYSQTVCSRVREQVSLELDGELSQLEQRMLATHLERCPRCAAYAADVRDVTERIRNAPHAVMQRPVVVRRRRPLTTVRLQVGVAAAFALAALGLGTQLASSTEPQSSLARFLVASACGGSGEPSVEEFSAAVELNRNRTDFVLGRITRAQSLEELFTRMDEAALTISTADQARVPGFEGLITETNAISFDSWDEVNKALAGLAGKGIDVTILQRHSAQ